MSQQERCDVRRILRGGAEIVISNGGRVMAGKPDNVLKPAYSNCPGLIQRQIPTAHPFRHDERLV